MLYFIIGLLLGAGSVWLIMRNQQTDPTTIIQAAQNALTQAVAAHAQHERATFLTLAGENLKGIIGPVATELGRLQQSVEAIERERIANNSSLVTSIAHINRQNERLDASTQAIGAQAIALVAALKNPTVRGRWGEIQLRRVVEMAGMQAYVDFDEQQSTEEGRPDLTINLPGGKHIFVDAKAPLAAYLRILEEPDETRHDALRAEHVKAVRSHIDALAKKAYHTATDSVDFTVMFVPGESFLQAALAEDPSLIEYAAGKNIYLSGPLTLMPLLRSYALGWRQQQQDARAVEIATQGAELYERLRVFVRHFSAMGTAFAQALTKYNDAAGSLEARLLPQGRRIHEAAALPSEPIEETPLIDIAPRAVTPSLKS